MLDLVLKLVKKKDEKIRVPVLYGHQGTIAQAFEVDGWHKEQKIVLEIEERLQRELNTEEIIEISDLESINKLFI